MTSAQLVARRLHEQALKERMIVDSIFILSSVEYIHRQIREKLLEIDAIEANYRFDELPQLRAEVLALLAKLNQEEKRMDEYMAKYGKLVNEKKALLSCPRSKKQTYLRGVPPNHRGLSQSQSLPKEDEKAV